MKNTLSSCEQEQPFHDHLFSCLFSTPPPPSTLAFKASILLHRTRSHSWKQHRGFQLRHFSSSLLSLAWSPVPAAAPPQRHLCLTEALQRTAARPVHLAASSSLSAVQRVHLKGGPGAGGGGAGSQACPRGGHDPESRAPMN